MCMYMCFGPQVKKGCGHWCPVDNHITIILLHILWLLHVLNLFLFLCAILETKSFGEVVSALVPYSGSSSATNDKPRQCSGLSPLFFFPLPGGLSLSPVFLSQVSLLSQDNCFSSSISSDVLHSQKGLAYFTYGERKHENNHEKNYVSKHCSSTNKMKARHSFSESKLLVPSCSLLLSISHVPRSTYFND